MKCHLTLPKSCVKPIRNWHDLITVYEGKKREKGLAERGWIFRGHKKSKWCLQSSLERTLDDFGCNLKDALKIEGGLLRQFKRQLHHFGVPAPKDKDVMEWFTLMQHYGAPTRLLDWTHSFFVALYFAVEKMEVPLRAEGECAVWALNRKWANDQVKKKYPRVWQLVGDDGDRPTRKDPNARRWNTFREAFTRRYPFVTTMNSYRLNERLVIQQGTFLCPGDIKRSFEENLLGLLDDPSDEKGFDGRLLKLVIKCDVKEKKDILQRLHRRNMNRATLFPGLDGFAQSLRTLLAFDLNEILRPDTDWVE